MITVLDTGVDSAPTYAQVTVKCNQDENAIRIEYINKPVEIYASEVCDYSVCPDEIVGYTEGNAEITVTIKGNVAPSPREFSTMVREFYLSTGYRWTSEFEHDILSEVYGATEI